MPLTFLVFSRDLKRFLLPSPPIFLVKLGEYNPDVPLPLLPAAPPRLYRPLETTPVLQGPPLVSVSFLVTGFWQVF